MQTEIETVRWDDYWCHDEKRWCFCPGPCKDGKPHTLRVRWIDIPVTRFDSPEEAKAHFAERFKRAQADQGV